jgi:hypothetical protein
VHDGYWIINLNPYIVAGLGLAIAVGIVLYAKRRLFSGSSK